jgi:hypothetical protein
MSFGGLNLRSRRGHSGVPLARGESLGASR